MFNKIYFHSIQHKLLISLFIFQVFIKITHQTILYQNQMFNGVATTYGGVINGGSCGFKKIWSNTNRNSQLDFSLGVCSNIPQSCRTHYRDYSPTFLY